MYPIFQLGPLKINPWGTMAVIAIIAAVLVAIIRAKKYQIPPQRVRAVLHFAVLGIIASFIGARLFWILEHIQFLREYPRELFKIGQGGLSWYGGLLFGFLVGFVCLIKGKFRAWAALDILAPGIALGLFFARIGCFLKGCCFGIPTTVSWSVTFPPGSPASIVYWEGVNVHPTQLYASFAALISFFILLAIERRIKIKLQGLIFFSFLILYGLWRFIIEFFRYHDPNLYLWSWVTKGHAFSITAIIVGAAMIVWTVKRHRDH
jgi:phosphatidylglycerol:prolipoprotein diacylglycerol transferase